jgi:hypothetical protein
MTQESYRDSKAILIWFQAPGLGMNPIESFARPEPGLDISQFDFVKNAAAVFKASQEKDKERFGG